MEKMTITEALSEINLIEKKVQKKTDTILGNLTKAEHLPDPFATEGGSKDFLKRELQSIADQHVRLQKIRAAIATANLNTTLTIGEWSKTVFEWLTWKREVAEKQINLYGQIYSNTKAQLDRFATAPQAFKDESGQPQVVRLSPNLEYGDMLKRRESLTDLQETLDGKLSLLNATTLISF